MERKRKRKRKFMWVENCGEMVASPYLKTLIKPIKSCQNGPKMARPAPDATPWALGVAYWSRAEREPQSQMQRRGRWGQGVHMRGNVGREPSERWDAVRGTRDEHRAPSAWGNAGRAPSACWVPASARMPAWIVRALTRNSSFISDACKHK